MSYIGLKPATESSILNADITGTAASAISSTTQIAGTNNTTIATTAFVKTAVFDLVAGAPGALDTLNELSIALGNDANFANTVTNSLSLKAPLASPTLTGIPIAPTAAQGTNTTQLATTAFVLANNFPVGTRMLFNQTSAPTGWTKDVTAALNDSALRIVTGTVGSGGSVAFSTAFANTAGYTLVTADMPSHAHTINDPGHTHNLWVDNDASGSGGGGTRPVRNEVEDVDQITYATTNITLGATGGGGAHSHGINVKYNDVIIASKD